LKSKNPFDAPLIDPKSLSHEQDLDDFVSAVKESRKLFNQPALDMYNGGEFNPGNDIQTDNQIADWLRRRFFRSILLYKI